MHAHPRSARRGSGVPTLALLALSIALSAQSRDPGGSPQTGTAIIVGTVTSDEASPQPMRRATITITGGGLRASRQTVTDTAGRFAIADLPAGTFNVTATKAAYLSTSHGAKGYGQPGTPIVLAAGQRGTATLRMSKGAVVSGAITDHQGRPPQQVRLQLLQYRISGGQRRLVTAQSGAVDDRGVFRIYGLPPGEYILAATPTNSVDVRPVTPEDIQWAQTDPRSSAATLGASPPPPPPQAGSVGFAPVYYSGATDIAAASTIKLGLGEERTGLDFQLVRVPVARVSGMLTDPEGRPVQSPQINLVSEDRLSGQVPAFGQAEVSRIDGTGAFSFTGVVPGRYLIVARSTLRVAAGSSAAPSVPPVPPAAPVAGNAGLLGLHMPVAIAPTTTSTTMWAMAQVDVGGRDVTGVAITLQPGLTVAGRIAFDASTLTPPADLSRVRLTMTAIDPGPLNMSVPGVGASADGSFLLQGVIPGRYRISASAPPAPGPAGGPWVLKAIVAGGRDVLDTGLEITSSGISGAQVVFSDRLTELTGSLLDAAGRPAPALSVMLFPTDRALWTPTSRRIRVQRPSAEGRFRFSPWFAGEFYLVAVTDADQIDFSDAAGLEQMAAVAIKVTFADGEKKTQDIRVR